MATNTYEALITTAVTSAVSSVNFSLSGITGYTDLVLVFAGSVATLDNNNITFNGDTAGNYSVTRITGSSSAAGSSRGSNLSAIQCGEIATIQSNDIIQIQNYSSNAMNKTVIHRSNNTSQFLKESIGVWRNTAPITSITVTNGGIFSVGSTFTIYGIASEGEVVTTAKATGGTITYGPEYTYHVFTSGGTFTPSQALSCDYLVVAGGGGGGSGVGSANNGGGGGAGGYRLAYAQTFASGTGYTVAIGSGGAADANGVNSSIIGGAISFASTGGGKGGLNSSVGNGGSGGGSSNTSAPVGTGNAGSYTPIEGNNGSTFQSYWAGGGGGAAYPGTFNGGGGDGYYTTLGPIPQYYAGGGGGGFNSYADRKGLPGLGGGGNGADYGGQWFGVAQPGTANTGGGGGGGASQGASIPGAAGGSGIVIIRYAS
jgi:hypothetical protein